MLLFKNLQKGNLLTDFETDDDDDDEDEEENENEQRATEVNTHALNVRQESRQSQTANVCDNWSSNTVGTSDNRREPLQLETRQTQVLVSYRDVEDTIRPFSGDDNLSVESWIKEAEVVKRKTPPSTEELEKRFNALEKQRSTTHIEANEVKSISATLTVEEHVNEVKAEVVEEKCQAVKQNLLASEQPKEIEEASPSKTELYSEQSQPKELSKRRASEPLSMEDLDKRYERLKRRMSNKNHFSAQSKTVNEALERIEQEVIAELGDATDEQERKPIKMNHPQQKIWKVDTRRCTARRKRWKITRTLTHSGRMQCRMAELWDLVGNDTPVVPKHTP
ncbi:hypothetical protein ACLKA7_001993 [Drosophila subpalustris]